MSSIIKAQSVYQCFEMSAAEYPQQVAISSLEKSFTYSEVRREAETISQHLITLGVQIDEPIGIYLNSSHSFIIAMLGILRAGGVYVPLDPQLPNDRLKFMATDLNLKYVLSDGRPKSRSLFADICKVINVNKVKPQSLEDSPVDVPGSHLACIYFTSGSSGEPKGVGITHENLLQLVVRNPFLQLSAAEVILQMTPLGFDPSSIEIWGTLLHGGRLVIDEGARGDIIRIREIVKQQKVTSLILPTGFFHQIVDWDPEAFCGVNQVVVGGDVLSPFRVRKVLETNRQMTVINAYGPTEAGTVSSYHMRNAKDVLDPIPIGFVTPGAVVRVVNEKLESLPNGEAGELCVGGNGLCREYINRPELNKTHFFTDSAGVRFYRTGDKIALNSRGMLEFYGRIDEQVKIRGYRVELGEIESRLEEILEVQAAAVVAFGDSPENRYLAAFLVPKKNSVINFEKLKRYLLEILPDYMIPTEFRIVPEIPLNKNGKMDRELLKNCLVQQESSKFAAVAPRTQTEEKIVHLWQKVLNLNQVGIYDSFFSIGGNSLAAAQIAARIQSIFGIYLPLQIVISSETVEKLAIAVEEALATGPQKTEVTPRRPKKIPLSSYQERIWFLEQLQPGNLAYNCGALLSLRGSLNASALKASLEAIIRRHEVTRTSVEVGNDGRPYQKIQSPWSVELPLFDFSQDSFEEAQSRLRKQVQAEFQWRFKLDQLPLMRWVLFKLSDEHHQLMCMEHHFLHDGWSFNVFLKELLSHYKHLTEGCAPLPELRWQYSDLTWEQQRFLMSQGLVNQLSYWKNQLKDCPPRIQLPADRARPAVQTLQGNKLNFPVPDKITESLSRIAKEEHATPFMVALTIFQILLQRYSQQSNFTVATSVSNRKTEDSEKLIGMVLNSLPLRAHVDTNQSLRSLIRQVKKTALDAYAHQDVPFEKIVDAVNPPRDLSGSPFFQVMFNFHDAPSVGIPLKDLQAELSILTSNGSAKCDLNIIMAPKRNFNVTGHPKTDDHEQLIIWEYDTNIYDESTMKDFAGRFLCMLENMSSYLDQPIHKLPWMSRLDKDKLVEKAKAPEASHLEITSLHQIIGRWARKKENEIALVLKDQSLTWKELDRRSSKLARHLQKQGLTKSDVVGILARRSFESIVASVAVLKAGGTYMILDPQFPLQRIRFMIEDARVRHVLCFESVYEKDDLQTPLTNLGDFDWISQVTDSVDTIVDPSQTAILIYTSGSTGSPKGVALSHRSILNLIEAKKTIGVKDPVFLQLASISFDASILEIYGALLNGQRLVLFPPESQLDEIKDIVRKERVTTTFFTTALFHRLVEDDIETFADLKEVIVGGEALQALPSKKLLNRYPGITLVNIYGPTETTVFNVCHVMKSATEIGETIPLGKTLAGCETYLLDSQMEVVPDGVPGEMYLGGHGLSNGYVNNEKLTRERFVPNPFQLGKFLYKTGDIAIRRSDGCLYFIGRTDFQVKIRGFRVELEEVEKTLINVGSFSACAVLAIKDASGANQLVALIESKDVTNADNLVEQLSSTLPSFMIPSRFFFFRNFPLNANKKVDREALLKLVRERDSELENKYLRDSRQNFSSSASAMKISEIWEKFLGPQAIYTNADFFEVGGHSLLAAQMLSQINSQLQLKISMKEFFNNPTISALIQLAEGKRSKAVTQTMEHIKDSCLPAEIENTKSYDLRNLVRPREVLLTGGTGFLGSHMLYELLVRTDAIVHCLVRAPNRAIAQKRLFEKFEKYRLPYREHRDRLRIYNGDLSRPQFDLDPALYEDLANSVQTIYHSAASTNFAFNYKQIAGANVQATLEILKLASTGIAKAVHHVSSVSVFAIPPGGEGPAFTEDGEIGPAERLGYGYAQSKWSAEKLMMAAGTRGMPITIYRPSRISGHSETGRWHEGDFLVKVIGGCAKMGLIPELKRLEDMVPVDYVAQAIIELSKQPTQIGKRFHITNPSKLKWSSLGQAMRDAGMNVQWTDYDHWFSSIKELASARSENPLVALLPLFEGGGKSGWERRLEFDTKNTVAGLQNTDIRCPEVDSKLLHNYLTQLVQEGLA